MGAVSQSHAVPTISVVMNAYNRESVIHFAIESVLAQTYPDFELIVVDDASTDQTAAVASYYVEQDPRVFLVRNINNSREWHIPWESKNDALRIARGRYIAYLDSDNTWNPRFLATMLQRIKNDATLQLVHCDSRNYYSEEECAQVLANDKRTLIYSDATSTIFSHEKFDVSRLGFETYIDTNEMMHRASVFEKLGCLWRVYNPLRREIQNFQGNRFPYRRHNDIDLVARIVECFGGSAIARVPEALANFYYPSAGRPATPQSPLNVFNNSFCRTHNNIHAPALNISHFKEDYLKESEAPPEPGYDFGVGKIKALGEEYLSTVFRDFTNQGGFGDRMFRYRGQVTVKSLYRYLGEYYGKMLYGRSLDEHCLVPFDGCQNALCSTIMALCSDLPNSKNSDVVYQSPAATYWATIAAARKFSRPLLAYSYDQLLNKLSSPGLRAGVILLCVPHNPLGIVPTEDESSRLCELARAKECWIVVDMTYSKFAGEACERSLKWLASGPTVFCDGISKSWGLPGLRLGFAVSSDSEIMALIRAQKSSESFLPSSLKQAFLAHLLDQFSHISDSIVSGVQERRRIGRAALEALIEQGSRFTLPPFLNSTLYEVLYVDQLIKGTGCSTRDLSRHLFSNFGVTVTPDSTFFNQVEGQRRGKSFIRLSFGSEARVHEGIEQLGRGLAAFPSSARENLYRTEEKKR